MKFNTGSWALFAYITIVSSLQLIDRWGQRVQDQLSLTFD